MIKNSQFWNSFVTVISEGCEWRFEHIRGFKFNSSDVVSMKSGLFKTVNGCLAVVETSKSTLDIFRNLIKKKI
jgi:hypothetical protein